jgi:hypothetical protein
MKKLKERKSLKMRKRSYVSLSSAVLMTVAMFGPIGSMSVGAVGQATTGTESLGTAGDASGGTASVTTNNIVSFLQPNTPNTPVNPPGTTNPGTQGGKAFNGSATGASTNSSMTGATGLLTLDAVTAYDFGTHPIPTANATYEAAPAYMNSKADGTGTNTAIPNFVQVTDLRGTGAGWTVQVAMTKAFTGDDTIANTGLVISLGKGLVATSSAAANVADQTFAVSNLGSTGGAVNVFGATANATPNKAGLGTNVHSFIDATSKTADSPSTVNGPVVSSVGLDATGFYNFTDAATVPTPTAGDPGVLLSVPGASVTAQGYQATLTWTLSNVEPQ